MNTSDKKQHVIHIDRKEYKTSADALTGAELRHLPDPDISAEYDLWLEVPGGADRLINGTELVELRNGMHFHSVQRNTNPG